MSVKIAFFVIILSLTTFTCGTRIITTTLQVPHQLWDLTDNNMRTTTVPFTLYARRPVRKSPLVIILPGALLQASDYQDLSSAFAYRGFVVAVPQYDQREQPFSSRSAILRAHLSFTSSLKPPCPANGQFSSAALVSTFLSYVSRSSNSHWLLRKILVDRTVIFGHSFGGLSALFLLSKKCDPMSAFEVPQSALACEQPAPLPTHARIVGLALFEGIPRSPNITFAIPPDVFVSVMTTQFYVNNTASILQSNGNLVDALISDANHFGPNDFTNASMSLPCAFPRPPEASFRTDYRTQRTVISTIATITSRSYRVFFKGQDKLMLTRLPVVNPRVQILNVR